MIEPRDRTTISPQVALRVAYLGLAAFVILGIIFFRLWYLQVLASDQSLAQARSNRLRDEKIPAPRGFILDRDNRPLVENRRSTVVTLNPSSLPVEYRDAILEWGRSEGLRLNKPKDVRPPPAPRPAVPAQLVPIFKRLAVTLDISSTTVEKRVVNSVVQVPYGDVQVKADVGRDVVNYIRERQALFPAVSVQERFVRKYPERSVMAQTLGTVGEILPKIELGTNHFREVPQGTLVGHEGLEYEYDHFLRGRDGRYRLEVTALGDRKGVLKTEEPQIGYTLKTSIDLGLQKAGEKALKAAGNGKPGAFVAMDPTNGEVLAMGSYPSYDPRVLSKPISQAHYRKLFGKKAGSPRYNRAIGGTYPSGSTFKPVTALAALASKTVSPDEIFQDNGCIQLGVGEENKRCNAGHVAHGPVNLPTALAVSSNVYFFNQAIKLDAVPGNPLQTWARKLGYGKRTGVDLPGEIKGLVPDPAWRDRINAEELACRAREHKKACGIGDGEGRSWKTGDEAALATGQGDLITSPLQVALSYATLANGGTVVRPHLGLEILNDQQELVQAISSGRSKKVPIDPSYQQAIMNGLRASTSTANGTTVDVFRDWPHDQIPIFGKTGTAVRPPHPDQSWFVCYAYDGPDKSKPIVIAMTIEGGGSGASSAAPATKLMLAKWFNVAGADTLVRGTNADR